MVGLSLGEYADRMEDFWGDGLITVFGAVLTVFIAYATFRRQQKSSERQILTNLIHDLHHKRAFRRIDAVRTQEGAESEDFQRTSASVLEVREWIRTARNSLPPLSRASSSLSEMLIVCNCFLSRSTRNPVNYQAELMKTKKLLTSKVHQVCSKVSGVEFLEPGEAERCQEVRSER